MEAAFYKKLEGDKVQCFLCPHKCIVHSGKRGLCRVRFNNGGILIAETYQNYSAISFDPIEKKPLYHFHPGKEILSLGSVGCNMRCEWCQNCGISQTGIAGNTQLKNLSAEKVVQMAKQNPDSIGIAFTYNEPAISVESVIETAKISHNNGLKNVLVSNGYISESALKEYLSVFDAFNIDVKAFDQLIHKQFTTADLKPVLNSLRSIKDQGKHLEITYLLIPGVNDDFRRFGEFIDWITNNLGAETVLHLSRYFPRHKLMTRATPKYLLEEYAGIATERLSYVFVGNYSLDKYSHTVCPNCSCEVINRIGYTIQLNGESSSNGCCPECGRKIFIT